jgi:hypothetical protein
LLWHHVCKGVACYNCHAACMGSTTVEH